MQEGKGKTAESMEELVWSQTELAATGCSSYLTHRCLKHLTSDSGMCVLTTSSKPRYLWKIVAKESDNEEFGVFLCGSQRHTDTCTVTHCCTSESPSRCTLEQSLNNVRMIDTILFTHPHRGHRAREKEQGQILSRASLCASVGTERESVAPAYLTKNKQIPRSCHPPPSRRELYTVHTHHLFVRKNVTWQQGH